MKRFSILAFCLISGLAIAIPAVDGQTNVPAAAQNSSQVAANRKANATVVHPGSRNIGRGPASFSPPTTNSGPGRMIAQPGTNFRAYSPPRRPLNSTLASMNARRHVARSDNVQPNRGVLPGSEIAQTTLPIANAQRMVRADDLKPTSADLAKHEISEGLETIDAQRTARNNKVQPIARDLANRETRQHTERWNRQKGRNRFSYSDALRRHRHEWRDCDWWKQHFTTFVFVNSGYYYLNTGYWYPAWGYDPLNSYYDYDGPIYTYGNLLPDQVIANVQEALQEAGYYGGPITGSLSVETRAALANYQRDQGLIITGAIDEPTVESLGLY
jgi:hypothetical protein